jgi:PAS domain S-box-containing protein
VRESEDREAEAGAATAGEDGHRAELEQRVRDLEEELQAQREELEMQNEELRVQLDELHRINLELGRQVEERKKAEEELKRRAALIDLSPDAIIVRRLDGTITLWSRGAEALYGWSKAEAVGQTTHSLIKTVFPVPLEKINEQLVETGRWSGVLVHTAKDGRRVVVQSWWLAEKDAQGHLRDLLESNVDITGRIRLEDDLREARDWAELYLDIMGHDIKNLNQVATTYLELIQGDENLTGEQRSIIGNVLNAIRGSAAIVDNVRKVQEITTRKAIPQPEDINGMILKYIRVTPRPEGRNIMINYTPRRA